MEQLGLERVLWIPVAVPPLKDADGDPGPAVRLALCRAATAGEDRFEVSDAEVRRGGPSYSVDTLRELNVSDPDHELTFIVGADAAESLPRWRDPGQVLELARLAVARRGELGETAVRSALAGVPGAAERVIFFEMPPVEVSSTQVRSAVAAGAPIDGLVAPAVAAEIARAGMYREGVPAR
jgi:nicotinate-nucleotide adenylyltransferase